MGKHPLLCWWPLCSSRARQDRNDSERVLREVVRRWPRSFKFCSSFHSQTGSENPEKTDGRAREQSSCFARASYAELDRGTTQSAHEPHSVYKKHTSDHVDWGYPLT